MIDFKSINHKELPYGIILSAIFLNFIGLVALKSISYNQDLTFLNNPFYKQSIFMVPSILICLLVVIFPRYTIHKYSYPLYLLGIILVIFPFFGSPHAGTYRWLNIGLPFSIQPSEFAKVFTTLALARYLSDHTLRMKRFSAIIVPVILVMVPTLIVLNQPDLGTSIVMLSLIHI